MTAKTPRIYLAGPDLFFFDAAFRYELLKKQCALRGFVGVAPVEAEDGPIERTPEGARKIMHRNIALLAQCDGVLANLIPFHGLEADSGTCFEVGYAYARGMPIAAYTIDPRTMLERASLAHLTDGTTPEDFGLPVNLMLGGAASIHVRADQALDALLEHFPGLQAASAASGVALPA